MFNSNCPVHDDKATGAVLADVVGVDTCSETEAVAILTDCGWKNNGSGWLKPSPFKNGDEIISDETTRPTLSIGPALRFALQSKENFPGGRKAYVATVKALTEAGYTTKGNGWFGPGIDVTKWPPTYVGMKTEDAIECWGRRTKSAQVPS